MSGKTDNDYIAGDLTEDHVGMVILGAGVPGWERHLLLSRIERDGDRVRLDFRWNDDPSPQNSRRGQFAVGRYLDPSTPVVVLPPGERGDVS